jgi:hypothetical protein
VIGPVYLNYQWILNTDFTYAQYLTVDNTARNFLGLYEMTVETIKSNYLVNFSVRLS